MVVHRTVTPPDNDNMHIYLDKHSLLCNGLPIYARKLLVSWPDSARASSLAYDTDGGLTFAALKRISNKDCATSPTERVLYPLQTFR